MHHKTVHRLHQMVAGKMFWCAFVEENSWGPELGRFGGHFLNFIKPPFHLYLLLFTCTRVRKETCFTFWGFLFKKQQKTFSDGGARPRLSLDGLKSHHSRSRPGAYFKCVCSNPDRPRPTSWVTSIYKAWPWCRCAAMAAVTELEWDLNLFAGMSGY